MSNTASRIDWNRRFAEASRLAGGARSQHGSEINPNPSYAGEAATPGAPPSGTTKLASAKAGLSSALSTVKNTGGRAVAEVKTWRLGEWGSLASIIGIGLWGIDQLTPGGLRGKRK